jgi:ATP-GRASP peptide maturase of grasp-with-spasm system
MVLIISEENDLSTKDVAEWLFYYRVQFQILFPNDYLTLKSVDNDYSIIINDEKEFLLNDIKSIWYRRGHFTVNDIKIDDDSNLDLLFYKSEYKREILHFVVNYLKNRNLFIGNYGEGNQNKIEFLNACEILNIDYPKFIICSTKDEIINFSKKNKSLITKSLGLIYHFYTTTHIYASYTHRFSKNDLIKIPEKFPTSFIQEYIPKEFEIRVFYLKGKIYSTAILSQKSKKAIVDFRKGYNDKNMRFCAFKLPTEIEFKVNKIMKYLNHNTGSLDIIYSKDKKYYFLELNPIGQFGGNSDVSNYRIEKLIANELRK